MKDVLKRKLKKGNLIYVVDYREINESEEAYVTRAYIFEVDEESETLGVVLYGKTYQIYSFEDYGRLFFDTPEEAAKAANSIPKPGAIVVQITKKKVYKKVVIAIYGRYTDGVYDLVICLNRGKAVSTKELGKTLFLNELDAKNKK